MRYAGVLLSSPVSALTQSSSARRSAQGPVNVSKTLDPCPDCGAPDVGGREGCQALWDEISARAYADPAYAVLRDLAFDAYCMQHVERYGHSAKSYAAHLTRLCCGLEYGGDPQVYAAIQKWLNGAVDLVKPQSPDSRGAMTVADLARTTQGLAQIAHDWAASVWDAYSAQHNVARAWIRVALHSQ
jgi:hypothetical protein